MIADGRALAKGLLEEVRTRAERLSRVPRIVALVEGETPVTRAYLGLKRRRAAEAGCELVVRPLTAPTDDADAVIVQLPVPEGYDQKKVCDAIPVEKDADVLSHTARELFEQGNTEALLPPVVSAVKKILDTYHIDVREKKVVVVGSGFLVGAPVATWLVQQGADVVVLTSKSEGVSLQLKTADIIVSGAGSPHLIKPAMLKEGVVLIDAGTSESGGALVGDADPACAPHCSVFTPVPGGVGPLAVACLFENAVILAGAAERSKTTAQ